MAEEQKRKPGFQKVFKDEDFLNALSETPQTTTQIMKIAGCGRDTAARTLKRLAGNDLVEMIEIEAGTGTGKMYLWKIKVKED